MKYVLTLFLLALSSCGSTADAEELASAADIIFSNESTTLSATNVQDAILELNNKVELSDLGDLIVGAWNGNFYEPGRAEPSTESLTLNIDGSYSCSWYSDSSYGASSNLCGSPASWNVVGKFIRLLYSSGETQGQALLMVNDITSDTMQASLIWNGNDVMLLDFVR